MTHYEVAMKRRKTPTADTAHKEPIKKHQRIEHINIHLRLCNKTYVLLLLIHYLHNTKAGITTSCAEGRGQSRPMQRMEKYGYDSLIYHPAKTPPPPPPYLAQLLGDASPSEFGCLCGGAVEKRPTQQGLLPFATRRRAILLADHDQER